MSAYSDAVNALSPTNYWRCGEASGNLVDSAGGRHLNVQVAPVYGVAGAIADDADTAIEFELGDYLRTQFGYHLFEGTGQFSMCLWVKFGSAANDGTIFEHYYSSTEYFRISSRNSGDRVTIALRTSAGTGYALINDATNLFADWRCIGYSFDGGTVKAYLDGVEVVSNTHPGTVTFNRSAYMFVGKQSPASFYYVGSVDEIATFRGQALSAADFLSLYELGAGVGPESDVLPLTLRGGPLSAYANYVYQLSPTHYWRMEEASGGLHDSMGIYPVLPFVTADSTPVVYGETGAVDASNAIKFDGGSGFSADTTQGTMQGTTHLTLNFWVKASAGGAAEDVVVQDYADSFRYVGAIVNANTLNLTVNNTAVHQVPLTGVFNGAWRMVTLTFADGIMRGYLDGAEVGTADTSADFAALYDTASVIDIAQSGSGANDFICALDEITLWRGTALSASTIAAMFDLATTPTVSSLPMTLDGYIPGDILPMTLSGWLAAAAASLPMRLKALVNSAAASLPMRLESADPTHYANASARWSPRVLLDNTDVSDILVGSVSIEHEEMASGLCSFEIAPATGSIDPEAYERKPVQVSFVGLDSAGDELYAMRRFTGITTTAVYDPDTGIVSIEATTDLQGRFENLSRTVIDGIVGGTWSEHIFDDGASGWQYAQDRLSTIPSEMHIDMYGGVEIVPFAAKATADITLTDDERFGDSLRITRASRRDLVTRVQINLDFRFVRLRHREITTALVDTVGFCGYLNGAGQLPTREMIRSAADGSQWTRVSDITYTEVPGPGMYCFPRRGWVGGAELFCLGAWWKAARRWAQTITEEYTLEVFAPDLEESVGQQLVSEDYGIEAEFDATDYETVTAFSDSPTGSEILPQTGDWTIDAVDSETAGRAEMEHAQEVAVAKAQREILDRARRNRVSVSPVYDPTITLAHTVAIDTPHLAAKGKVYRISEMWSIDSGDLDQTIELAVSRHGGSGLASTTPVAPADEPDPPQEEVSDRAYYVRWRVGGTTNAAQDNEEWDGWMTNVVPFLRDPAAPLYRTRFVLRMPEIEEAARDATSVQATKTFELAVPNDTLTMSN